MFYRQSASPGNAVYHPLGIVGYLDCAYFMFEAVEKMCERSSLIR